MTTSGVLGLSTKHLIAAHPNRYRKSLKMRACLLYPQEWDIRLNAEGWIEPPSVPYRFVQSSEPFSDFISEYRSAICTDFEQRRLSQLGILTAAKCGAHGRTHKR